MDVSININDGGQIEVELLNEASAGTLSPTRAIVPYVGSNIAASDSKEMALVPRETDVWLALMERPSATSRFERQVQSTMQEYPVETDDGRDPTALMRVFEKDEHVTEYGTDTAQREEPIRIGWHHVKYVNMISEDRASYSVQEYAAVTTPEGRLLMSMKKVEKGSMLRGESSPQRIEEQQVFCLPDAYDAGNNGGRLQRCIAADPAIVPIDALQINHQGGRMLVEV